MMKNVELFLIWNGYIVSLITSIYFCYKISINEHRYKTIVMDILRRYQFQILLSLSRVLQLAGLAIVGLGASIISFEWLLQASRERLILFSLCYAIGAANAFWMASTMIDDIKAHPKAQSIT
jgi:hypothetical protein